MPDEPDESPELRAAYEERGRRLAEERLAMADRYDEMRRRALEAEERCRYAEDELTRLQATRTFRWTQALRDAYGRLRGGRGG